MVKLHRLGALAAVVTMTIVFGAVASGADWKTLQTSSSSFLASDGAQFVAMQPSTDVVRLFDTAHRNASQDVRLANVCTEPGSQPHVISLGSGEMLIGCDNPTVPNGLPWTPVVYTIATRTSHQVPNADAWTYPIGTGSTPTGTLGYSPTSVGTEWIEGTGLVAPVSWIDWHTGAQRQDTGIRSDAPNLDSPDLFAPMCSGLRRGVGGQSEGFTPVTYKQPFALVGNGYGILSLQRCGSTEPTVLGTSVFSNSSLVNGVAAWSTGADETHAYFPACGVRLTWPQKTFGVVQTTAGLFTTNISDAGPETWTVRELKLARGCGQLDTPRATFRVGARNVTLNPDAGSWTIPSLAHANADVLRIEPQVAPSARLMRGTPVALRTDAPAHTVRWRLDGGSWHAARSIRRTRTLWRFAAPSVPGPTRLTLSVRYKMGGRATFDVSVRRG